MAGNQKVATLLVRFLGFVLIVWGLVNVLALLVGLGSPAIDVPSEYSRLALWPSAVPAVAGFSILILARPLGAVLSRGLDD
jgi:hypothetical protein